MGNQHGEFIWYELLTSDVEKASAFYGAVLGWRFRSAEGTVRGYHLFGTDEADVGGIMTLPTPAPAGAKPAWLGYVGVNDVDATAASVIAGGGTQHVPPTDIPGVGRFAMLADPQGALFYVMRGSTEGGTSTSFAPTKAGHAQWNELTTPDPATAFAFYAERFGWAKGDAMPMGPKGDYQLLELQGKAFGALMKGDEDTPRAAWKFFFGVSDIDRTAKLVTENGGTIHHGPSEVPGGDFILLVRDPQGASVGLVGPRKKA